MTTRSEKERVYQELDETRRKLAKLKAEVRHLNRTISERTPVALNVERARLRKALSYIAYSPQAPADVEYLKQVAATALNPPPYRLLKGSGREAKEFRAARRAAREAATKRAAGELE